MDLKKTIDDKITNLHGATIDDNYDLTGFKYDDNSNQLLNSGSNQRIDHKGGYIVKKDSDEVFLIDPYVYVTNNKSNATSKFFGR